MPRQSTDDSIIQHQQEQDLGHPETVTPDTRSAFAQSETEKARRKAVEQAKAAAGAGRRR